MAAKSYEEYPYKVSGFFQYGSPFKTKGRSATYEILISKNRGIESAKKEMSNLSTLGGICCQVIDRKSKEIILSI